MNLPLNINFQQILLHWMNFALLAGGLYFLLYKPVHQFMEKRAAYYQNMEHQAQEKIQSAEQMKADYQALMDGAEEEIHQKNAAAQLAAQQSIQEQMTQAELQAKRILAQAKVEADQTREWARHESQKAIKDMALVAAKKLAARASVDPFDQFLDLAEKGTDNEKQ